MKTAGELGLKRLLIGLGAAGIVLAVAPLFLETYVVYLMTMVAIWTLVGLGINLIIGYAGQLALGHGAFYAVGAYTLGLLMTKAGWPLPAAIAAAGVVAAIAGVLFAFPAVRVSGLYLALVTFGLALIVQLVASHWVKLTNGPYGVQLPAEHLTFMGLGKDLGVYYLAVVLALVGYVVMWNLVHSDIGRSFIAVRESEIAAAAVGVNLTAHKVAAFAISAFYVGIAGALYAISISYFSPAEFGAQLSLDTIFVGIVGGLGSLAGPLAGAVFLRIFPEFMRSFKEYQQLVFGVIILAAVVHAPDGLAGIGRTLWARYRKPAPGVAHAERTARPGKDQAGGAA